MIKLLVNIRKLIQAEAQSGSFRAGKEMRKLPVIENAYLKICNEKILDFGPMTMLNNKGKGRDIEIIDCNDRFVMPSFCDSHTHLVYAGSREMEYIDKVRGLSYEEIAKRGGGILNSAKLLHETTEDELFEQSSRRVEEIMHLGTGAVEIKSGYGLNTEDELKMLKVIKRLKETWPLEIKSTFLGAHSFPWEYRENHEAYVDLIINEMIPAVSLEGLADYIDVFCDRGFFSVSDTDRILNAGMKYGMRAKIHANELDYSGGIQVGVKYDALSVDHLEYTGNEEIKALQGSDTMPTLLPGASFFLEMDWAPARRMIDEGLPIALASDLNPGSSPSGNMHLIMSMALIKLHMLPEEIFNAVTLNSAYAMGVENNLGSINPGKLANLIITKKLPSLEYIPYGYGSDFIEKVMIKGQFIR